MTYDFVYLLILFCSFTLHYAMWVWSRYYIPNSLGGAMQFNYCNVNMLITLLLICIVNVFFTGAGSILFFLTQLIKVTGSFLLIKT